MKQIILALVRKPLSTPRSTPAIEALRELDRAELRQVVGGTDVPKVPPLSCSSPYRGW